MDVLNQFSKLFDLDIRNTIGLLFWGNLALATLVFIFRYTNFNKNNKTQLLVFGYSKILQSLGWLFLFLRSESIEFNAINILVSNTLIFTSVYLESIAMLMLIKGISKKKYRIQSVLFVIIILIFSYAVLVQAPNNIRVTLSSIFIFLLFIIPAIMFITESRSSLFKKILGFNYITLLAVLIFKTIYSFFNSTTSLYSADPALKIFFLVTFMMMIVSGVGYLLLMQEEKEVQIKKLLNDKNTFFSIIAHDLRGPFNGIIGLSELILEKDNPIDSQEANEFIKLINESSKNTYSLLENLLTWAQSQTGSIEFNPKEIKIISVTERTVNLFSNVAKHKKITIQSQIKSDQYFLADKNMLETIFRNLISNAIKFTNPYGEVILSMENQKNQVVFSIKDNGIGISSEKIPELFATNHRNTTLGTNDETGTGIGLMLCKEFVEKHRGKLWVESEINKGSTFKFSIPN